MSLAAGARLGPYEIREPIGAGGMGEVYRARDTKLGRDVAIKVLPKAFAQDGERLARFERGRSTAYGRGVPTLPERLGTEHSIDLGPRVPGH